jgi:ESS family glutamate:Na+ symporter
MGESLVKRISLLARFNIPVPVVGGLGACVVVLFLNTSGLARVVLETSVTAPWWSWPVTTPAEWAAMPAVHINRPFLVAFFTCIGLNASWQLVRRGSWPLVVFLLISTLLAVFQNLLGIGIARLLGVSSLIGLVCGAVTLTGGVATSAGFADVIAGAGLPEAGVLGAAAATFGMVAGGLTGGPVAGYLILRHRLTPAAHVRQQVVRVDQNERGFLRDVDRLFRFGWPLAWHLLLLIACLKGGAWLSALFRSAGLTFPVYIGSMILGVLLRNLLDLSGAGWIRTEIVEAMNAVFLGLFLSVTLMTIPLDQLANAAVPMLIILGVQVAFMAVFAYGITFRGMGGDYDAAVMAGGHCGFGLGTTPNAVANMEALVERFGPSPRAFLIVPIVGAFLLDFTNALVITVTLNWIS